jgi:hypothetical protein
MIAPVLALEVSAEPIPLPRLDEPYRLWSLWDMLEPFIYEFGQLIEDLLGEEWKIHFTFRPETPIPVESASSISKDLDRIQALCERLELDESVKKIARIQHTLTLTNNPLGYPTYGRLVALWGQLREGIMDESRTRMFLYLPGNPNKVRGADTPAYMYVQKEPLFGRRVKVRFPNSRNDVIQCGQCFAVGAWTASVFHGLRVLEAGVKALFDGLNVPQNLRPRDRTWGALLRQVKSEIDKRHEQNKRQNSPTFDQWWEDHKSFFEEVHAHLNAVKIAWRDPTMHVEDRPYTREQALDIIKNLGALMRRIASHLDEMGNFKP